MVAYQNQTDLEQVKPSALERADRAATGRQADLWRRFTAFTLSERWRVLSTMQQAVMANLTDLVTLGDAQDYLTLNCLLRTHGHEEVAAVHNTFDRVLGLGTDMPTVTSAIRRLADSATVRDLLVDAGKGADEAADIARTCYQHMFWILLCGIDEAGPSAPLSAPSDLARLIREGNARSWRAALAPVAANPWGPYGEHLARLATEARLPLVARWLIDCRKVYRLRQEEQERLTIAREIRRLIAISGCSQRQFAAYVGTSPSRLSTYATGKVTPSAAMLLRIQRAARGLHEESQLQRTSASPA